MSGLSRYETRQLRKYVFAFWRDPLFETGPGEAARLSSIVAMTQTRHRGADVSRTVGESFVIANVDVDVDGIVHDNENDVIGVGLEFKDYGQLFSRNGYIH